MHYVLLVDVKVAQIKIVKRVPLTTVYWKNVPTWRHGTEFPRPGLSTHRWNAGRGRDRNTTVVNIGRYAMISLLPEFSCSSTSMSRTDAGAWDVSGGKRQVWD